MVCFIQRLLNNLFSKEYHGRYFLNRNAFLLERKPNPFLVFFNMGFGDSFLIDGCSSRLLVDCGSKNMSDANWNTRKTQIRSYLKENPDLLITHYHGDHLNKIPLLSNEGVRFNNIYVRNLGINNLDFDITNIFTQLAIYAAATNDFNTLFFWLDPKLLFNLVASGGKVIGVNTINNNFVNIGYLTANILWPDIKDNRIKKTLEKNDFLTYLEKYPATYYCLKN